MAKMGRPRKVIDQHDFENLCAIQCTEEEICQFFSTTPKTLNAWCKRTYGGTFSKIYPEKRGLGKISLRRSGFNMAKTNPSVHIFYAKNFLGMSDRKELEVASVEDLTPLAEMINDDSDEDY